MITIIFAPPRMGKTCFMTYLANNYAFDKDRNYLMKKEIVLKNDSGFSFLNLPDHCVSANYSMIFRKFRYLPRTNRFINPYRLGFSNTYVETHFNLPYEAIFIDEAQQYLNSRMSSYFPDWQSRWYEQHGHNNIDIFLATQRPMLIDVNVRELSQFIEIVSMTVKYKGNGSFKSIEWCIRKIANSGLFDKYMSSGKRDKSCFTEEIVKTKINIFECYDSQSCKPKFYLGNFDRDFDYLPSNPVEDSIEGYIEFLNNFDDELPANFYQSRSKKKKD